MGGANPDTAIEGERGHSFTVKRTRKICIYSMRGGVQ